MKKSLISGLILTSLLSTSVFASPEQSLTFGNDQIKKDPTFHCSLTGKDKGTNLGITSTTNITLSIRDSAINFGTKGKLMDGISVADLDKYYFLVTKDNGGDGTVYYSTNNETMISCAYGTAGHERYND